MLWSYGILHNLCYYLTVALCALLLLGYCHCNIFCGLIILYYNAILILLYCLEYVVHPIPLFAPHTYYICDFDNSIELCWCNQPPVLHQHISHICNFYNRIGYVGAPNHILHHIQVKFASWFCCKFNKVLHRIRKLQYKYLDYFYLTQGNGVYGKGCVQFLVNYSVLRPCHSSDLITCY